MRKIIQPKRINKNITVQSYWQIRNKQKKLKKQVAFQAYREDEVANRFRYLKPTQQAKQFNPLSYFFRRTQQKTVEDQQYANNFKNQQFSFVHEFLSSVRFRVSGPLVGIKRLIFGLKSIIHNHEAILNILLRNLQCEDTWSLLQGIIKDTKQHSYGYWMRQGLKKLAYQKQTQNGEQESIYQNFFHQIKFQNLFDTLSIIMQANYEKIMQNLNQFFQIMNTYYFNHDNKYIRKFSMRSVSYIINNLSLQDNLSLIFHIVLNGAISQKSDQIPIGQLLLNRHRAVKGCLSSVQINKVVQTLKQIPLFLIKSFEESQMDIEQSNFKEQLKGKIQSILVVYIAGILDLLQTKFGRAEQGQGSSQILFDLNYCIKAFVSLQQKQQSNIDQLTLIKAFSKYLQNCDDKRFLTHNHKHQNYINETFKLILGYLQTSTIKMVQKDQGVDFDLQVSHQVAQLLGLVFKITPKESSKLVLSKGITHYCKILSTQQAFILVQKIYSSQISDTLDSAQKKSLGEFLFLSFSKFIKDYFEAQKQTETQNQDKLDELLYTMYQILKKIGFTNTLSLNYLSLEKNRIIGKAKKISNISQFILVCRLISILNTQSQNDSKFSQQLSNCLDIAFKKLIKPFSQSLETLVTQDHQNDQNQLFSYNSHIKNLLRYSHHEVEWVSIAFNLQDCYKQILRKISLEKSKDLDSEKWIWSELSLNRTLKIDQSLGLNDVFKTSLNLLQSRNRLARKAILQRILQIWSQNSLNSQTLKSIVEKISNIDSDDIDIDNQRDIKKQFVLLQKQISELKNIDDLTENTIKLLANWVLGFGFTGFKLVNDSIVSFLTIILDSFSEQVSKILFPFIQYYIYRHSRQFQFDTTESQVFVLRTPKKVQSQFNDIKSRQIFYALMKQDFSIQDQNTIEWIGLERIGQALGKARKFKNKDQTVKAKLENYLNKYFSQQFFRKNKVLSSYKMGEQQPNKHLIMQPKTRFLAVMLKLCPETYLPPYECLHYLPAQYLSLGSVHNIKKNRWQALWVKKLKGTKSKQQITDSVNTSIALDKMSLSEQQLYAHFLWRQIIQSNQQKRRNIFQHIRDRISDIIPYMFQKLLFGQMLFLNEPEKYFSQVLKNKDLITQLKQKLLFENKKTLLNLMYVLKAMIVVFKNYLRTSNVMQNIVIVLRSLIQVAYTKSPVAEIKQDQYLEQEAQDQNEDQIQDEQEQDQVEQVKQLKFNPFLLYKPHRKQIYKVLTEIFTHYSLEYEQAESLLSQLSRSYLQNHQKVPESQNKNIFAKVAYATVNSVPGIIILLKVISSQSFYHHLLLKFGILDLAASILEINDQIQIDNEQKIQVERTNDSLKKKQSNPHAVKQCLDILANIFGLHVDNQNNTKMQDQGESSTQHQNMNSIKWKHSLQNLLKSINHYFLYSRNLNQSNMSGKSNANVELEYYSNENKQNINSIQNNKNRNKNQQSKHETEAKNLDTLWEIVGKIVTLRTSDNSSNQINLDQEWQQIFWTEINKIVKVKQFKQRQHHKLFKIVQIALVYFDQQITQAKQKTFGKAVDIEAFLCKIISVLPHISQLSQRIKLTTLIHNGISTTSKRQNLRLIDGQAITIVSQINAIKRNGLNVEIDYDLFFAALNRYSQENVRFRKSEGMVDEKKKQLNLLSHQYIIYNLLPYLTSQQLSVRKAVRQALNSFLVRISVHLQQYESQTLKVYNSILRLLIQQLKKNQIDNVFWSILSCIGLFIRFQVKFASKFDKAFDNAIIFTKLLSNLVKVDTEVSKQKPATFESQSDEDFFHMITSISQGNKMKALRMLKDHCVKLRQQGGNQAFKGEQKGSCLPHPLPWILATLQHLVLPVKHFANQHQYNVQGNLTSTLTYISLQIYEVIIPFARQSLIKKQLKRLSTKIKFNETMRTTDQNLKKNILVIKIITSIVEGIDTLDKCTGKIKSYVEQHGFDEFHSKLIQNARTLNQQAEDSDQEQQKPDNKKKVQFGANLQQLQPEQAINRNFMMFDRKLMAMEQKQNHDSNQSSQSTLIKFLKLHVLIPLKLMLFYESKSSKEAKEEQDKSRMMISVAITKLLIKFPMDMFLFEFQKVLSKLCRLLKKRKVQIRQNGRKSLCQIAKIVGPQMLYAIVLQLKFHLRDNFQKHIFNFTVFQIIQTLSPLKQGDIDYCLPLILPMIIDEMFGQSSQQKKMVQANQVPVLNMQTKKKKGHQLLILLSRQISVQRIRYMIDYLQKFLKQYLNSEVNLSKYDMMINHLTNGLGSNQEFISQQNAGVFGQILCDSMYELRRQIKIYNFQDEKNKITHQTTIKVNTQKSKKIGKQTLLLQQEAGRNGSIFKKMSKQVYEKRNKEIIINCLVQFYLALGSLLIKKQVFSLKTLEENKQLTSNFIKIMQFVFQCMDHRDNRIVSKCMRLLHQALVWNYEKSTSQELKQSTKSLRKKVSRKILLFIQKLTSSDAQLLKQSFVILIDLFTQVTITKQFLPSILAIIKLHTNNQNDDANIPEPYRLLKLIIYKVPECIYDPLIYQMYEMTRINIVNSNIKQIRDVCRQIASTYVKNKQFLCTGIELGALSKQKNKNKSKSQTSKDKNTQNEYTHRIKKQLNFYISNLDCRIQQNQLLVLDIVEQWISNRSKGQVQQVSQLILLSLATSVINGNEHTQKVMKLMADVFRVIDRIKIYELLEKTLVWVSQPRQKAMIRQCGYLLLNCILKNKAIQVDNPSVKTQYLLRKDQSNLFNSIQTLLLEEINILEDYLVSRRADNKGNKVQNKDWNNIIEAIEVQQSNPYLSENKILQYCIEVITDLVDYTEYQAKLKENHVITKVWRLLKLPQAKVCAKSIAFLQKVNNLTVHLQSQKQHLQQNVKVAKKEDKQQKQTQITFYFKSTIASLINNGIQKQNISDLLKKLHMQPSVGQEVYVMTFDLMMSFLGKLVMKFKFMQPKAQTIYYLLNEDIIKNKDKSQLIFKQQQNQNKIIDSLGKVSRNQFVSVECKAMNQQCINVVKQMVGVSQFYKKLTKFESERRQKKTQQKAHLAILAVTDQKAYIDAKKKKVKIQF